MEGMMDKRALDDPQIAAAAWARFRRLMRWMAFWGVLFAGAVLSFLYWQGTPMPLTVIIATSVGVWGSFMLGTALMSLAFLSNGTGHDEEVDDRFERMLGYRDE